MTNDGMTKAAGDGDRAMETRTLSEIETLPYGVPSVRRKTPYILAAVPVAGAVVLLVGLATAPSGRAMNAGTVALIAGALWSPFNFVMSCFLMWRLRGSFWGMLMMGLCGLVAAGGMILVLAFAGAAYRGELC